VKSTLGQAVLIVVAVIFLFLGSFRSVLIPIVTIPLSLVGGIIMALGFTLNLLTLLAMVLAIGLVVDDAIVVLETYRHIEEAEPAAGGALIGARKSPARSSR
jgi:multidrug efflux pump